MYSVRVHYNRNVESTKTNGREATARHTRVPRGSLTRDQIIEVAARLLENGGVENLSIRHLATQLGVSPMAIYRHVRDKDDLLDELVDDLLAVSWRPTMSTRKWTTWVEDAADRLRGFLVSQPIALSVYLRHPVTSPAALSRMEAMIQVLEEGLGDDELARRAYAAIHTYTVGFAALEASRNSTSVSLVSHLERELAEYTTPAQFREALASLIAGYVPLPPRADPYRVARSR